MFLLRALPLALCLTLAAGCARQADVAKPKHFSDGGIAFDYPGNWRVTKNEKLAAGRLVFLEEPGSAIVALTVLDPEIELTLEEYAQEFRKNVEASMPLNLARNSKLEQREGRIDMVFSILNLPHTANLTLHPVGSLKVFCATQVADEDRRYVDAGFGLVRRSLRAAPPAPH